MCEQKPNYLDILDTINYLDNLETVLMEKLNVSIDPTCWTSYHKLLLELIQVRTDVHLRRMRLLPCPCEDKK